MDTEHSRIISSAEDRYLPVPLTDIEVDEYGRQLAAEVESLSQIDAEKKAVAAEIKKRRDEQESVVLDITRKVNTKTDERLVTCDIMHDYYKKKVEVVRRDTGEAVESRPMNRAEYERGMQMEL
jgi:hypothetical protein